MARDVQPTSVVPGRRPWWVNTYAALIVPGLATTFGTFLMRQFFLSIPSEYIDAARIDSASEPRIYWQIMLPMCRPALSALAVFSFTNSWNSFLWPLVVVNQDEMRTIPSESSSISANNALPSTVNSLP